MPTGFQFLGNTPWLDFLNTEMCGEQGTIDLLVNGDTLLDWGETAGLLDAEERESLGEHPGTGDLLDRARPLRRDLRDGALRLMAGESPSQALLQEIGALLDGHPERLTLTTVEGKWAVRWRPVALVPSLLLARIAADYARFLASAPHHRLRRCMAGTCMMLFLDTSKNGTRRWCSMELCGNRAKAASHRQRQRRLGGQGTA